MKPQKQNEKGSGAAKRSVNAWLVGGLGKLSRLIVGVLLLFVLGSLLFQPTRAAVSFNQNTNFQGRLTDSNGNIVQDGTYNIQFNLYTVSSGGSTIWTETRQNFSAQGVTVTRGLFSVQLGSVNSAWNSLNFNQ